MTIELLAIRSEFFFFRVVENEFFESSRGGRFHSKLKKSIRRQLQQNLHIHRAGAQLVFLIVRVMCPDPRVFYDVILIFDIDCLTNLSFWQFRISYTSHYIISSCRIALYLNTLETTGKTGER